MVKSKRAKLVKKLDDICRDIVRARDGHVCQKCGKHVQGCDEHNSHVLPKSMGYHVRWVIDNLKTLCMHCHLHWWHKNPVESGEWFKEKFPERWERLQEIKQKGVQRWRQSDLEELYDELKEKK